jgi:hypothetical protein
MSPQDFEDWYVKPLDTMNGYAHGGFAVLLIAIPLLERYLREKSGCFEANFLNDRFHDEFSRIFPCVTRDQSKLFWTRYRHGLLHQATLKQKPTASGIVPKSYISSRVAETPEIINYDAANEIFVLLPKEFSERIVQVICSDFATFLGYGSTDHPLPVRQSPATWTSSTTSGKSSIGPTLPPTGTP